MFKLFLKNKKTKISDISEKILSSLSQELSREDLQKRFSMINDLSQRLQNLKNAGLIQHNAKTNSWKKTGDYQSRLEKREVDSKQQKNQPTTKQSNWTTLEKEKFDMYGHNKKNVTVITDKTLPENVRKEYEELIFKNVEKVPKLKRDLTVKILNQKHTTEDLKNLHNTIGGSWKLSAISEEGEIRMYVPVLETVKFKDVAKEIEKIKKENLKITEDQAYRASIFQNQESIFLHELSHHICSIDPKYKDYEKLVESKLSSESGLSKFGLSKSVTDVEIKEDYAESLAMYIIAKRNELDTKFLGSRVKYFDGLMTNYKELLKEYFMKEQTETKKEIKVGISSLGKYVKPGKEMQTLLVFHSDGSREILTKTDKRKTFKEFTEQQSLCESDSLNGEILNKNKTIKQIFEESLSLDVAKKFSKDWNREHYNNWFGKNIYRLYFDHDSGDFLDESPDKKIENILNQNGYEIENWESGLAKKKGTDKNFIKIGKLLQRLDPTLKKTFDLMKDKTSKMLSHTDKKLLVVISRHPYDIAGMSTDREWRSCTELDKKTGKSIEVQGKNIEKYIKNNALISYLIKADDKNINAPIGRIIIYPYTNVYDPKDQFLVMSERGYGKITVNMKSIIQNWLNQKQGKKLEGSFEANFYSDDNPQIINFFDKSKYNDIVKNPSKYGIKQLKNIEDLKAESTWFFDGILDKSIKVKDVVIEFDDINDLIFRSGTWHSGIWHGGVWKTGTWEDGIWTSGIWEKGMWKNGTWETGTWFNGTWKNGTWEGGIWNNGTWKGGTWYNGTWFNGIWFNGTWRDGTWRGGIWEKGTWHDGVWFDGMWKSGVWKGGTWYTGKDKNFNNYKIAPNNWV